MNYVVKVLVLNLHSMFSENATGITLRNILKDTDGLEFRELYYYEAVKKISIKNEDLKIESKKINSWINPVDKLFREFYKRKLRKKINEKLLEEEISNDDENSQITSLRTISLSNMENMPLNKLLIRRNIKYLLKDYSPDLIYTFGSSIFILKLGKIISEMYDIPIVIHHLDNWRESKYGGVFEKRSKKSLEKLLMNIEGKSKYSLVISEEMSNYYSKKYNLSCYPLMNTLSKNQIQSLDHNRTLNDSAGKKVFIYAGGLHLGRWKTLLLLSQAIESKNINAEIKIFTSEENRLKYQNEFSKNSVLFSNYVSQDELNLEYSLADVLLHVESFDDKDLQFTKYSLSTKIPEYLCSGKLILAVGNSELASIKYFKDNNAGYVIDNTNMIKDLLEEIIHNISFKNTDDKIENAKNLARYKHSLAYKNKTLHSIFNNVIENW